MKTLRKTALNLLFVIGLFATAMLEGCSLFCDDGDNYCDEFPEHCSEVAGDAQPQ